jgi:hypothetical protein
MWGGGDHAALEEHLEEGLRLFRSIDDHAGTGLNLATHSGLAWHHGDDQLHYSKASESLSAFESAGHLTMIAQMKRGVGLAQAGLGEVHAGRPLIIEGLRLSEELGDIGGLPLGFCFLGLLEVWGGNRPGGVQAFRQSIIVNRNLGQMWPSLLAVAFCAEEACLRNQPADGIRLGSVLDALTSRTGMRLPPRDRLRVHLAMQRATDMLDSHDVAKIREDARQLHLPQALRLALEVFQD